ncbi:U-box domain-containing protein [Seminavis robusta]|uniref:U-box domain-containing protein n=1 Tax=Seminavis robusta TaxID=568900 RepID=A0A9N8DUQ0_9STRA|nr:U-box domain-containing protein [Seminavis robusta]|eukprot:Sro305_g112760.1 U-box domain-containing protein (549) ;mRNA; r:35525-37271
MQKSASGAGGKGNLDDADFYDNLFTEPEKPTSLKKSTKKGKSLDNDEDPFLEHDPLYILGTLIVRVVAARDLPAASNGGGLGDFLFGGGKGSANPYASVNFGCSTQRTSNLHDTLDPVWPRGETMFMDVALPLSNVTHPHAKATCTKPPTADNTKDAEPPIDETPPIQPPKNLADGCASLDIPRPILTVALFSADERGNNKKYNPSKGNAMSGDSDDEFLGVASVDLTPLLTGKKPILDSWLPLSAASGSIRVNVEYEPTDVSPSVGDKVQFTRFCHPADLFPLVPGQTYTVQGVVDEDRILLGYTSQEGWICSFLCHKNMVICVDRKHGAVEVCKEEWQSITERLAHSPLVGTVQQAVEKLPEEGLLTIGASTIQGGAHLINRWLEHGLDTAVEDVAFATNWDGRFNPGGEGSMANLELSNNNDTANETAGNTSPAENTFSPETGATAAYAPTPSANSHDKAALPNMPCCPITGEPMIDPVVAGDGHTYERAAIERWLQTSDKSPLTGSILLHKQLVPNYGLLSSLREQAEAVRDNATTPQPEGSID